MISDKDFEHSFEYNQNLIYKYKMTTIDLSDEDKFDLFRNWVKNIALAGMEGLIFSIDQIGFIRKVSSIVCFIFSSLIDIDLKIISSHISKIFENFQNNNELHEKNLILNLSLILESLIIEYACDQCSYIFFTYFKGEHTYHPKCESIMRNIFEKDPPPLLFNSNKFRNLLIYDFAKEYVKRHNLNIKIKEG